MDVGFLVNLKKKVTGTTVGSKHCLDVNVEAGTITAEAAPTEFVLNGADTQVTEVTATPANSRPFPTKVLDSTGAEVDFATEAKQDAQNVLVGAVNETAPATDIASSGLNGRLQRVAQRITSLIALVPTSLGQKTMANGFAVTLASDQSAIPATVSGVATSAKQDTQITDIGDVVEAAPASDTASSGLNGRLQRIAQRLTSLIALVPASLGQKTMANSFAVTIASDQTIVATAANQASELTLVGAVTETAPASDTASSGLNGRLQRIAQRITSLIALVPASLGQKAMAASFAVTLASDQTAIPSARNGSATDSTAATATGAAEAEAAPADAVGFFLSADAANTDDVRWRSGGTASTTAGHELQPGRDTGYIPCAADLSICAVSSSQKYQLTWVRR